MAKADYGCGSIQQRRTRDSPVFCYGADVVTFEGRLLWYARPRWFWSFLLSCPVGPPVRNSSRAAGLCSQWALVRRRKHCGRISPATIEAPFGSGFLWRWTGRGFRSWLDTGTRRSWRIGNRRHRHRHQHRCVDRSFDVRRERGTAHADLCRGWIG